MMLYDFFRMFLMLSLMGSVLTAMILLVKALLGRKTNARWHYYIWLLLLARLVIPFAPQHSLSVFNIFKPLIESAESQSPLQPPNVDGLVFIPVPAAPEPAGMLAGLAENAVNAGSPPASGLTASDMIGLAWAAGALIMAAFLIGANLRFTAGLRGKPRCRDKGALEILDACRKELGIKRDVPLILDPRAGTPLLSGLTRPMIVSSRNMIENMTDEEKRYIFLHELMHLKKMDILFNWIMAAIKCVYWFNPVIWYACFRMKEDCEYACDESVLGVLEPVEYKLYGHTILNLVKTADKPILMTCTTGMAGRKPTIKRRINMIAKFRKKTLAWTIPAIALTLLVGCSAMTGAKFDSPDKPGQDITSQNPADTNTPDDIGAKSSEGEEPTAKPAPASEPADIADDEGVPGGPLNPLSQEEAKDILEKHPDQGVVYDDKGNIILFTTSDKEMLMELSEELNITIDNGQSGGYLFTFSIGQDEENEALHDYMNRLVDRVVRYYIDKLKDKSYTGTYGDGYTWYTAAEELGRIGRPAVPYLIEKLKTTDDYERSLALYALLLATQQENVKAFAGNDYINVNLDFDAANHPSMVKTATDWWEKYKDNF